MTDYKRVKTHGKTEPAVSETFATVVKTIHEEYKAKLVFGLQSAGQDMVCRYLVGSISPRLYATIILKPKEILISLHNADSCEVPNDAAMPRYAKDLANQIRSATRGSKLVKFKQESLRAGGSK